MRQISVYVQSRYSCRMFAQTLQDIQRAETVPAADSYVAALWITHTTTLIGFIFVSHTGAVHHHVTVLSLAAAHWKTTQLPVCWTVTQHCSCRPPYKLGWWLEIFCMSKLGTTFISQYFNVYISASTIVMTCSGPPPIDTAKLYTNFISNSH